MNPCPFVVHLTEENGIFTCRCEECGYVTSPSRYPCDERLVGTLLCGRTAGEKKDTHTHSFLSKAASFSIQAIEHAVRGLPTCSQTEIDRRLAICQKCEHFKIDYCNICGCRINGNGIFMNMLAWEEKHCPLKEPKW